MPQKGSEIIRLEPAGIATGTKDVEAIGGVCPPAGELQNPFVNHHGSASQLLLSWLEHQDDVASQPVPALGHTRSIGGENSYTVLERLWERPALEVIALAAGDPVGVPRAAVPSMASAEPSIRTVAGQKVKDVADQVRRFVDEAISDHYAYKLSLDTETAQEFYRTPESPLVDALSTAMAKGFAVPEVGRMGNAGGGPADLLSTALDVPVVFFGTGLVEDNWHDSDESVRADLLKSGAATLAFLWEELGRRAYLPRP